MIMPKFPNFYCPGCKREARLLKLDPPDVHGNDCVTSCCGVASQNIVLVDGGKLERIPYDGMAERFGAAPLIGTIEVGKSTKH